ncbi:hypothetical protein [Desulfurococcus mucosus]|uniref:hypothetical protein n=1 Tax=Desulfurococcus mucosus TaxID=2275 RepID=UPI00064FD744|nr:hypothetical protein [Desulfurococcus mucosus]
MLWDCEGSLVVFLDSPETGIDEARSRVLRHLAEKGGRRIIIVTHREADVNMLEALRDLVLSNHVYSIAIYEAESRREAIGMLNGLPCSSRVVAIAPRSRASELSKILNNGVALEVV